MCAGPRPSAWRSCAPRPDPSWPAGVGWAKLKDMTTVPGAETPRGRFPHARRAGDYVYVSGTSARRPDNSIAGAIVDDRGTTDLDIRVQTRAVLDNLRNILSALGGSLRDVVSVTS